MTAMVLKFFNSYGLALELRLGCAIFIGHLWLREKFRFRAAAACAGLLSVSDLGHALERSMMRMDRQM